MFSKCPEEDLDEKEIFSKNYKFYQLEIEPKFLNMWQKQQV